MSAVIANAAPATAFARAGQDRRGAPRQAGSDRRRAPRMVTGLYYDGRDTRGHPVTLFLSGGEARVVGADVERRFPGKALFPEERMDNAPRQIALPGGGECEFRDSKALDAFLLNAGIRESRIERWQRQWGVALAAVIAIGVTLAAGYQWGLPWAAEKIAFAMPYAHERKLGDTVMKQLERGPFGPSRLTEARRAELTAKFHAALPAEPGRSLTLHFRSSAIGPNAFAVPGGHVILTDELVHLAADDAAVLGVLAHEVGHLKRRHSLRKLIQFSAVSAASAWLLGDVSGIAAGAMPVLLGAKYSRDLEREADAEAIAYFRAHNLSTEPMVEFFRRMEAQRPGSKDGRKGPAFANYLSSHPATEERIRALRGP
jgi:Zn-dependent protease with chaperone function